MSHLGTGQHRLATKQEQSEQLARDIEAFKKRGGRIKELAPQQLRPVRLPEFNKDPHKWGKGEAA